MTIGEWLQSIRNAVSVARGLYGEIPPGNLQDLAGSGQMLGHKLDEIDRMLEASALQNGIHSTVEVAALVEEMLTKGYEKGKARLRTTLEALLDKDKLGSAGRLVDYALDDIQRAMLDIVSHHSPEITSALLDEKRQERIKTEADASMETKRDRLEGLRNEVSRLEYDLQKDGRERRLEFWHHLPYGMTDEGLKAAVEHMATWRRGELNSSSGGIGLPMTK